VTAEPTTRVDGVAAATQRWRHDLADRGGRNTLLWFQDHPRGTFDLTVAHPSGVAKLLAGQPTLLTEIVRERVALAEARARVGSIHAKSVELLSEHGVSTCFVAVGMATWHLPRVKVAPRAPVLLRAASLVPTDPTHQDFVLHLDQHVTFNPVLENYLRGEVGIDFDAAELARLSAPNGFDPRLTYRALERLCDGMDGFGINPQTVIATFPWAKLDLVAHLSADSSALAAHPLVSALAEQSAAPPTVPTGVEPSGPGPRDALQASDPQGAEDDHDPRQEFSVLDADRAQRAVIDAAHQGESLVLDTPAGTGATQTLANIVAVRIAQGRTALVVSEERPALDALRRRLAAVGLDEVTLDLAESPPRATATIAGLARQLDEARTAEEPVLPEDPLPRWLAAREVLAQHDEGLHHVHQPWGRSLAQTQAVLASLAKHSRPPTSHVRLSSAVLSDLPRERIDEVARVLTQAAREEVWQRGRIEDPWYGAALRSPQDADRAQDLLEALAGGDLAAAREEIDEVCRDAGLPEPLTVTQWQERLDLLRRVHATNEHFRLEIYEAPLPELIAAVSGRDQPTGVARPGAFSRGRSKRAIRSLLRPGKPPSHMAELLVAARQERTEWEDLAGKGARPHLPHRWQAAVRTFDRLGPNMRWLADVLHHTPSGTDLLTTHLDLLLERLLRLDARRDRIHVAATAYPMLQPLREAGLGDLVDDLVHRGVGAEDVADEVELVYQASLLDHICAENEQRMPSPEDVTGAARELRRADREHLRSNALRVRRSLVRRLNRALTAQPGQAQAVRDAAAAGSSDLRGVIARSPDVVLALRPVVLGSPLVVPAALPHRQRFDLVVVEHAHRTPTSACVASIRRGDQTLVVGDHTRYGPSPFSYAAERPRGQAAAQAEGSLLADVSSLLPVYTLDTHYRSLDQRLVRPLSPALDRAVHSFPGVWPAPRAGVRLISEASELAPTAVATVVDHLMRRASRSVMVLADTSAMADAVSEGVRQAARDNRTLASTVAHDESGEVLCSSLTRWAGEVRDRVVWVRDPDVPVDSSAVMTVLAAARRSVTMLTTDQGGPDPQTLGAQMLEQLLKPSDPRAGTDTGHQQEPDGEGTSNPLLDDLCQRLETEGYVLHRHVGQGRYVVPLAIEDPNRPGRLLVAIDFDFEPSAHRPGRDGTRLRVEQLTRLGWTPVRVLSSNLFRDPAREVAALVTVVRDAAQPGVRPA
jgi:hypothetical protein